MFRFTLSAMTDAEYEADLDYRSLREQVDRLERQAQLDQDAADARADALYRQIATEISA